MDNHPALLTPWQIRGMNPGYVYIMTNRRRTVLYAGVTNNLQRRVAEHKAGYGSAFTSQYKCDILVYFIAADSVESAILEEKRVKNRRRSWKDDLITAVNPTWADLSDSIGVTPDLVRLARLNLLGEESPPFCVSSPYKGCRGS